MVNLNWESFDGGRCERTKICGGWLVRTFTGVCHNMPDQGMAEGWDWRVAMCFVPDPEYNWHLDG